MSVHARRRVRDHATVTLVAVLAAALTVLLLASWPDDPPLTTWRAAPPRVVPDALLDDAADRLSIGSISLGDPLATVTSALGDPTLVLPSLTKPSMSWSFPNLRVVAVASGDLAPTLIELDAFVTGPLDRGPQLAGGVELGRSTIGALVGVWGPPGDAGVPAPTSVRYVTCRQTTTVLVELSAGGWSAAFSAPIRHVHMAFIGDGATGLCAADRR